jgi:hypothetical protein
MRFKEWLLKETSVRVQWDYAITLPALGIQGATTSPNLLKQGTHADIYEHPSDASKLIKITDDHEDAANIVAAQAMNSPSIVKCHAHTTAGVQNGAALLVDFVKGQSAPYSTLEFLALLEGEHGTEPRSSANIRIMRPDVFRMNILKNHGKNQQQELLKLSRLFRTIHLLESKLNIFLVDLADNVMDAGQIYVIVDLGR